MVIFFFYIKLFFWFLLYLIGFLRLNALLFYYLRFLSWFYKLKLNFIKRLYHRFLFKFVIFKNKINLRSKQYFLFFHLNWYLGNFFNTFYDVRYFFNFPLASLWLATVYLFYLFFGVFIFCVFFLSYSLFFIYKTLFFTVKIISFVIHWYKFFTRWRYYSFTVFSFIKRRIFIFTFETPFYWLYSIFTPTRRINNFLYY